MPSQYFDCSFEIKADSMMENGMFEGYGSTFGGKPDSYGDVVAPGAFTNTLSKGGRNGSGPAMLWCHDSTEPLGVWTMLAEDKKGLKVQGQLAMKTYCGMEKYELMKMGAVKGLSIGYETISYEYDEKKKIRTLTEVDLWEISLCTFPANTKATVTAIKAIESAQNERELERALRDAGLSKSVAQFITKLAKPSLREAGDSGKAVNLNPVLQSLKKTSAELQILNKIYGA